MQRQRDSRLEFSYQLIGNVRRQQATHVFKANNLHAHGCQLIGHPQKIVDGVDGADRIADRSFNKLACFQRRFDGGLHVPDIVHGIENAENIDARVGRPLDKRLHDIVRIITVAHYILPAQQHLETSLGHRRAQLS